MSVILSPALVIIVSFTLEAKLDLSKHLIQVRLEILSRSVKNVAPRRQSLLLEVKAVDPSIH